MNLRAYLESGRVPFDWFLHAPAPTASRLAGLVHVPGHRVAKAVLLRGEGRYLLAVLPATCRVDLDRFSAFLHGEHIAIASEAEVGRIFPDCERGAVPPFGRLYGIATFVDRSLGGADAEIVGVGNQRHEGFRLPFSAFLTLERPELGDFATAPPLAQRKAG